jgi:hypothetical protein
VAAGWSPGGRGQGWGAAGWLGRVVVVSGELGCALLLAELGEAAELGELGVELALGAVGPGTLGRGERAGGVHLGLVVLAEGVAFTGGVGADMPGLGAGVGLGLAGAADLGGGDARGGLLALSLGCGFSGADRGDRRPGGLLGVVLGCPGGFQGLGGCPGFLGCLGGLGCGGDGAGFSPLPRGLGLG